jgi:tRNA(Met) C34 N-acetyltransferase TmcA
VRASLSRGVRAAGDLIPWTLSQQVIAKAERR